MGIVGAFYLMHKQKSWISSKNEIQLFCLKIRNLFQINNIGNDDRRTIHIPCSHPHKALYGEPDSWHQQRGQHVQGFAVLQAQNADTGAGNQDAADDGDFGQKLRREEGG